MTFFQSLFLPLVFFSPSTSFQGDSHKPDLVIEQVQYTVAQPRSIYHRPGQPGRSGDNPPYGDFAITVRNIGTADFADAFYITWTENESDIRIGHYSHGLRVNSDKKLIYAGDSLVVHVHSDVYKPGTIVKHFIQSDGKPHLRDPLPKIDESNYDNNTFEYIVPNISK